jgi:hypothetical protein
MDDGESYLEGRGLDVWNVQEVETRVAGGLPDLPVRCGAEVPVILY